MPRTNLTLNRGKIGITSDFGVQLSFSLNLRELSQWPSSFLKNPRRGEIITTFASLELFS